MELSRAVIVVLPLIFVAIQASAEADRLAVIVHPKRSVELDREALAQIYLKRRLFWSAGEAIVPINREAGSAPREAFSRAILRADPGWLSVYWNRAYFRGVLPPATLASDQAVRRFVASEPRAIGYIASRHLDESIRVVFYLDDPDVSTSGSRARR